MSNIVSTSAAPLTGFAAAVAAKQTETGAGMLFLLDCSFSMQDHVRITLKGKINAERMRIDILRRTVADLRRAKPNAQMMAFGPVFFQHTGEFGFTKLLAKDEEVPDATGGGTPLAEAIRDAAAAGAKRIVILSDGVPNDQDAALEAARAFGMRVDCIYIGGDGEADEGAKFLAQLAEASGGNSGRDSMALGHKALADKVIGLLGDGSNVAPTIIL
jgi:hypothetical protein